MSTNLQQVDHSALKINQATLIVLLLTAFISNTMWLVIAIAVAMLIGTLLARPSFLPIYRGLRALRIVEPDVLLDNPEPHRFSQGFGGLVLIFANFAWILGLQLAAWSFVWLVIALAALNLFGGFCVGCALYYWLHRLGWPGFSKAPPPGTTPGRRPPRIE
ncbi:MAG: DUF4395 family protein [Anaerolineales bacterium]|nr:DUF4395 family protein [Anaerolineales bacterium]